MLNRLLLAQTKLRVSLKAFEGLFVQIKTGIPKLLKTGYELNGATSLS